MSFYADLKDTFARFGDHISAFQEIYKRNGVKFGTPKDIWGFITKLRSDEKFRQEVIDLGNVILKRDGGKISLSVLFAIIALSIGGIGIAGLGSAIGIPVAALACILGLLGFGVGQEIDTKRNRNSEEAAAFAYADMLQKLEEALEPIEAHSILVKAELERLSGGLNGLHAGLNAMIEGVHAAQSNITSELRRTMSRIEDEVLSRIEGEKRTAILQTRLRVAIYVLAGIVLCSTVCLSILIVRCHAPTR